MDWKILFWALLMQCIFTQRVHCFIHEAYNFQASSSLCWFSYYSACGMIIMLYDIFKCKTQQAAISLSIQALKYTVVSRRFAEKKHH